MLEAFQPTVYSFQGNLTPPVAHLREPARTLSVDWEKRTVQVSTEDEVLTLNEHFEVVSVRALAAS